MFNYFDSFHIAHAIQCDEATTFAVHDLTITQALYLHASFSQPLFQKIRSPPIRVKQNIRRIKASQQRKTHRFATKSSFLSLNKPYQSRPDHRPSSTRHVLCPTARYVSTTLAQSFANQSLLQHNSIRAFGLLWMPSNTCPTHSATTLRQSSRRVQTRFH